MKNKIIFTIIIILVFVILMIPLKGSYAFYNDNKDLEIINTKVGDWNTLIGYLRMNDKNNNLSPTIQGDMYRYQGTDNVANWICFGTTENCGTNDELIDKYMYRIIGITPEGEMKLIKETFLKEGSTSGFAQNDRYYIDPANTYYCPDGKCPDWPDSELFKRLNGTSNGTQTGNGQTLDKEWTDIFVDSEKYDYLRSGDRVNGGTSASSWYNLISDHQWLYGDTKDTIALNKYNGDAMYQIESGAINTTHYVGIKGNVTEQTYKWPSTNKVKAKISLMYWHDYYYSYYDGNVENSRGNAESYSKLANSWLYFRKDGYNTSDSYEWLSTRWGIASLTTAYIDVFQIGTVDSWIIRGGLHNPHGVRPVFYITNTIHLTGEGTKSNPFVIKN